MTRGIYAIWDIKANDLVADVLTIHRTRGTAVRMFTDALQGKGDLANHPADYKLVCMGVLSQPDDAEPEIVDSGFHDVYTGLDWLEATKAKPSSDRTPLTFPGVPASDR